MIGKLSKYENLHQSHSPTQAVKEIQTEPHNMKRSKVSLDFELTTNIKDSLSV